MSNKSSLYVTSSELAEYIYCECCWYDKRDGLKEESVEMQMGTLEHIEVQQQLLRLFTIRNLAFFIIGIGLLLLLFVILLSLFANL